MQFVTGDVVGPYEVLSRLGRGGMGDVYLARDPRLDRRVALKVLRPRPGTPALDRRKVLREGRAVARIVHPLVAAVFDVVDIGDLTVLVLEYVEGRTLRQVIEAGPLPPAEACGVAAQICDAIDAAHAHGVVHGDIKPENVCLTATGQVKVLDFGIARVMARAGPDADGTVTTDSVALGSFAGTPRYAAPELFAGAPADPRTDVYAVGAVLFEMLTGLPPHAGHNAIEIGLNARAGPAPRVDGVRRDVPAAVADVVARALAGDRHDRTPTAASLATSLRALATLGGGTGDAPTLTSAGFAAALSTRVATDGPPGSPPRANATTLRPLATTLVASPRAPWHVAAAAAVVVLLLAGGLWRLLPGPPAAVVDATPRVLAILPLEPVGQGPHQAAIGMGIADTLIADLADARGLVVVSRRAATPLSGRDNLAGIARELGATLLVDGTVQAVGDALRVAITLVRPDGTVAWGRTVEGTTAQLFDLQRQLVTGLREALHVQPAPSTVASIAERATRPQGPASLDVEALSDYTDALQRLARQDLAGNIDLAVDGFTRALDRDPGFVLAHVGLSDAHMAAYRQSRDADALERATRHADRAAALAPYHAETWVAVARVRAARGQADAARQALERALGLQPTNDEAWRELADVQASQGQRGAAEEALRRAVALRPGYWRNHHEFGRFLFEIGRLDEAASQFRQVIEFQPDSPRGYQALGTVLQAQGRDAEAILNYERATRISPSVNAFLNVGVLHHWAGRFREAIASYERAAALAPEDPVPQRNIGDSLLRLDAATRARTAYARALGLAERELTRNPTSTATLELHAVLLAKLGRFAEAERQSVALAASPGTESAHYARAVVLALSGRQTLARPELERAIALGYPRELAARDEDLAGVMQPGRAPVARTTTKGTSQ